MSKRIWTNRELDVLRYLREEEDLTFDDIAEQMGRTEPSVRHKYNRMFIDDSETVEEDEDAMRVYDFLRRDPKSLGEIVYGLNLPPQDVEQALQSLQESGVQINKIDNVVSVHKKARKVTHKVNPVTYDNQIKLGFISDIHAGSIYSQPTNLNKFIYTAVDEGVRDFFFAGDGTDGVGGYSGHDEELVRECSAKYLGSPFTAVLNQALSLVTFLPEIEGVTYYMLGGNHDEWSIKRYGIDPIRLACDMREDLKYLGYYSYDVPLTESVNIRLEHPKGGVPYSKSYRSQKAMESLSYEALFKAAFDNSAPDTYIVALGHLHITNFTPNDPMYGMLVPCFMGSSLYLKRSMLTPQIGGVILDVNLDRNRINRVKFDYLPYPEIVEDYKNWDVPFESGRVCLDADPLEVIYSLQ